MNFLYAQVKHLLLSLRTSQTFIMNYLYAQVKHLSWTFFTHRSNLYYELSLRTGQTFIMNFLYTQIKPLSWIFKALCAHFLYKFYMLAVALLYCSCLNLSNFENDEYRHFFRQNILPPDFLKIYLVFFSTDMV